MSSTSCGKTETEKLKQNLERQLDRLMEQLADLESCKDNLDPVEYEETKEETMDQLKELNESLSKLVSGNVSLVSALGAIHSATQMAISQSFKTPEVIRLFGRRDPSQLRQHLKDIDQPHLNKLSPEARNRQKGEILIALRQLNEQLTTEELQFLEKHISDFQDFKSIEFLEVKDASS